MNKKICIKKVAALALALALAMTTTVLTGCGKDAGTDSTSVQSSKEGAENGKITLKVLDGYGGDMVEKMIALYGELNPDINIEYEYVPSSSYYSKFTALNVAGQAPDVTWTSASFLVEQVQSGVLADLTDELENGMCYEGDQKWVDTMNPVIVDNSRSLLRPLGDEYLTKSYGIPFTMTSVAVVYDKTLFDSLGIKAPKTWAEFMSNNETLKNAGHVPISMQQQNIDWWPRVFWDQTCRDVLDENPNAFEEGKMDFSDEKVKEGLTTVKKMWDQGYFPESALTANRETMLQLFVQKEMPQILIQSQYLEYLTTNAPEGMELASYALPGIKGLSPRCLGGSSEVWAVSETSKHKDEAVKLIKFLTSKTAFSEDYAKFVTPCLKDFSNGGNEDILMGYQEAADNGFIPDIYVPVNATTELSNTFKTDIMPNFLLGIYSLDDITGQMNTLYQETYLNTMK